MLSALNPATLELLSALSSTDEITDDLGTEIQRLFSAGASGSVTVFVAPYIEDEVAAALQLSPIEAPDLVMEPIRDRPGDGRLVR